jgi:predicted ATPase
MEAQIRFNLAFQSFVAAIASDERPVAIFIDDLQWADSATLNLMQTVTVSPDTRHVLFLGAYRDNEVTVHHPLVLAIAQLRKSRARVSEITLKPLQKPDLERLVADALFKSTSDVEDLAAAVHEKTDGNPFYVGQFLRALEHDGLLAFDPGADGWTWDVARIRTAETTANVVDLMVAKIRRLPTGTQTVLQLSACIGNRFDLDTLGIVSEASAADAGRRLWPAVREGLVLPVGEAYRDVPDEDHSWAEDDIAGRRVSFRFLHDRVQQAAGALMDEDEERRVHLRIGRLLLEETPDELREERLFDITDHLNAAIELVKGDGDRLQLAELNLQAGRKAAASSAFAPAARYLETGIGLLGSDAWERHYDLALGLHVDAAEARHMSLETERGSELGDVVLAKARAPLDKVPIYEMRIQLCVTQGRMRDAVLTALEPLEMLGVRFPENPKDLHALWHFGRTWFRIRKRSMDELLESPLMTDPETLAAMRLLMRVISAAYQGARELFPLLVLSQIDLTLEHGNSPHSSYAYGAFATTIWVVMGDLQRTYEFGKLGHDLALRFPDRDLQARGIFMFNNFQRHWKEPQRACYEPIVGARQLAVEGGDLEYYAYCLYHAVYVSFFAGESLGEVRARFEDVTSRLRSLDMEQALPMARIGLQMSRNLTGQAEARAELEGSSYSASGEKQRMLDMGHFAAVYYAHLAGTILAYQFGDHQRAVAEAAAAEEHIGNVMAMIVIPGLNLFQSLACIAAARDAKGRRRSALLGTARRNQKKMAKWAAAAPGNFGHKHDLVAAELAGATGAADRASSLYDDAIRRARAERFPQEEAIAAECAALHYLRQDRPTIASAYMREAVSAYMAWGADAKVQLLRETYPELLRREVSRVAGGDVPDDSAGGLASLDIEAVVRASQAVSGEIVLDRLLERLMTTVLQSAGADRGALVRVHDGGLVVEAVGDSDGVRRVDDVPVTDSEHVPRSVVALVARTGEALVLDDAAASPDHADDPYVARHGVRSVLAVPMRRRLHGGARRDAAAARQPGVDLAGERAPLHRSLAPQQGVRAIRAARVPGVPVEGQHHGRAAGGSRRARRLRAVRGHPVVHRVVRVDGARGQLPVPQLVPGPDGADRAAARGLHRQVHGRRDHGPLRGSDGRPAAGGDRDDPHSPRAQRGARRARPRADPHRHRDQLRAGHARDGRWPRAHGRHRDRRHRQHGGAHRGPDQALRLAHPRQPGDAGSDGRARPVPEPVPGPRAGARQEGVGDAPRGLRIRPAGPRRREGADARARGGGPAPVPQPRPGRRRPRVRGGARRAPGGRRRAVPPLPGPQRPARPPLGDVGRRARVRLEVAARTAPRPPPRPPRWGACARRRDRGRAPETPAKKDRPA